MDEKDWVKRIQNGDESARERLYTQFQKRLYATAVHFLGYQDPEAMDAVQEAYAKALAGIRGFRPESGLYSWMNHICVKVCFDRIRARKRSLVKQHEDLEILGQKAAARAQHLRSQEGEDRQGARAILGQAAQRLKEPCQSIVRLRDLEGKSYVEVSRLAKIPMGTVMSRLSRCGEQLKKDLLHSLARMQP